MARQDGRETYGYPFRRHILTYILDVLASRDRVMRHRRPSTKITTITLFAKENPFRRRVCLVLFDDIDNNKQSSANTALFIISSFGACKDKGDETDRQCSLLYTDCRLGYG